MFSVRKLFIAFFTLVLIVNILPYTFWQWINISLPDWSFSKTEKPLNYVPWELIVKFKETKINVKTSIWRMNAQTFATNQNMHTTDSIITNNIVVMKIQWPESVEQKIIELESDPNIEYVEPNYIRHIQSFTDTYSGNLWGLMQISWYQAFSIFSWATNPNITWTIVAVLDAWVAYDHPDLVNQMWNGISCKDENGTALWWCIHGYDFADNDKNPYPVRSDHWTHVAWTIGAEANNTKGILWVNFNANIMAIRVGDDSIALSNIIKWIDFAIQNGAKIINASFGGSDFSQSEYDAVHRFKSAWWLFITAAGNDGTNNDDWNHFYPCDFNLDNIVCVAATDTNDTLASFSNYGISSVDIGAPWVNIYSTLAHIVETSTMNETFESIATGTLPLWRTQSWIWSHRWVLDSWITWRSHVLYTNLTTPYSDNTNSTIQKTVNTANTSGVTLDFWAMCDTQYSTSNWYDYMTLEVSDDGSNFIEIARWDESYLDTDNIEWNNTNWLTYAHLIYDLTWMYISSNFTFTFRRVTDWSNNNYTWCLVDDVVIKTYTANTTTEPYWNMDWTSMASPHVAWLASLAWSYRPDLTYADIKNALMTGWDAFSALSGKTVSWKRINAYRTLYNLTSPVTGSITFLSWTRTNITWTTLRLVSSKTWSYEISGSGMIGILTGNITLSWIDTMIQLTSWDEVKSVDVIFSDTIPKQSQRYTASIILDTTAPNIPILVSPISWVNISWIVNLLWSASVDTWWLSGYSYEIASDSGMTILIASWNTSNTWVVVNLFSWASYYRRVKAFDKLDQHSPFSQTGDFVLLWDSWPDAFNFTAITNAELNTQYTSNQITIGWINTGTLISILGGSYQINTTGDFISTTWIVYSWDKIQLRLTASSVYSTQTLATLYVGTIPGNFSVTTKSAPSGWGGGGWWGWGGGTPTPSCLVNDLFCSGWVYVMKTGVNCIWGNLGNTCTSIVSWSIDTVPMPILRETSSPKGSIKDSPYSAEMNSAYLYAYDIGITTMNTIQKSNMTWSLIRAHMAKMMVNYAIKVMSGVVNSGRVCEFNDIAEQSAEMKLYIKLACQLGLMGVGISNFDPNGEVTRAQFGTVLSRVLWGDKYNTWIPFYLDHLNALKINTIISNTDPELKELRGYVMLMLMRASN